LEDLPHEAFWILLLNRANRVIGRECISTGGVSGTVVDAKIVFRKALEYQASSLILGHNHPSGNLAPSTADRQLTAKLIQAGKHLDIAVLDHLIVTNSSYYSFADEGDM
jgi:DNA repair protein RadC